MSNIWNGIKKDGEILPLGCVALFFVAALYPVWSGLFFWQTWALIGLLAVAIGICCLPIYFLFSYIKSAKKRGIITERDEFWANMIFFFIILFFFLLRR